MTWPRLLALVLMFISFTYFGTSVGGLPRVEKSIDWVRLAARFPVRIRVEDPDESFRIGASAVVTVGEGGSRAETKR